MKKIVGMSIVAVLALSSGVYADENADLKKELKKLQKQMKSLQKRVATIRKDTNNDNVKFSIDMRSNYDKIEYDTVSGKNPSNNILSNRFMLNMVAQPTANLVFKGSIVANKLWGHNNYTAANGFNNYDWFGTVTPDDGGLRLREANFIHFGELNDEVSTTFSIGRRPSLDGNPGYLREGNFNPSSPTSHNINMEFDGASLGFNIEQLTDVNGMNFKLCAGRGYSNSYGKYNYTAKDFQTGAPNGALAYATNDGDTPDMDMLWFIFKAYDDSQYKVSFNYSQAVNLLGIRDMTNFVSGFQDVGDMTTMALTFEANGIGDAEEGFLAESKAFISFARSETDPNGNSSTIVNYMDINGDGVADPITAAMAASMGMPINEGMLGSADSQTGTSIWAGFNWPCQFDDTMRLGIEYNEGSQYWRSFTYGEDTLVGSKLAARGSALEFYANKDLIKKYLTMQVRYTKIDYDYTGSDMFFGASGTPMNKAQATAAGQDFVDSAENIRVSLRYRY